MSRRLLRWIAATFGTLALIAAAGFASVYTRGCRGCHGDQLQGDFMWEYATARTGKAVGDRELPMMSGVARGRFAHFTDGEVSDLYAFLRDMALRAAAAR